MVLIRARRQFGSSVHTLIAVAQSIHAENIVRHNYTTQWKLFVVFLSTQCPYADRQPVGDGSLHVGRCYIRPRPDAGTRSAVRPRQPHPGRCDLFHLRQRRSHGNRTDGREDRSGGHHAGTLLQDRSRDRSPQVLPRLDDQGGRGFAVDRRSMSDSISGNGYNEDREWTLPENGCLAKRRNGYGKSANIYVIFS